MSFPFRRLLDDELVRSSLTATVVATNLVHLSAPTLKDFANFSGQNARSLSLSTLPPEIMVMIVKAIKATKDLCSLRLVSRGYNDLVLPLLYRNVSLSQTMADTFCFPRPVEEWHAGQLNMVHHTQRLVLNLAIGQQFYWPPIHVVIDALQNLKYLYLNAWTRWDPGLDRMMMENFLPSILMRKPHLDLVIERYALSRSFAVALTTLPLSRVVRFKFGTWTVLLSAIVKNILLQSTRLIVLEFCGNWKTFIRDVDINDGDRLAAIHKLVLRNYVWSHSRNVSTKFWNWSMMTYLELSQMRLFEFLSAVPPQNLVQLNTLLLRSSCDWKCAAEPHCKVSIRVIFLVCRLLGTIRALKELALSFQSGRLLHAIIRHGPTLTHLTIYDGYVANPIMPKHALKAYHLAAICRQCPGLVELALQVKLHQLLRPIKIGSFNDGDLRQHRNLRRLMISTMTNEQPTLVNPRLFLSTDEIVRCWLRDLVATKEGAKIESVAVHVLLKVVDISRKAFAHYEYTEGQNIDTLEVIFEG